MDPAILAALFGKSVPGQSGYDPRRNGIGGGAYDPQPQDAPSQAASTEPESYEVTDDALPPSKYSTQLFGGDFAPGKKWSNVLGMIGDALLVGSGADPIYNKQLQQLRESEAMGGFTQDPRQAAENLAVMNPGGAAKLWNDTQDNERQQAEFAVRQQQQKELSEANVHKRNLAYLGAATAATYPGIKARVMKDYADRGMTPPFDLPETFDPAAVRQILRGGVDPKDQITMDNTEAYRKARLAQGSQFEAGRNYRTGVTTGVRQSEGEKTRTFQADEHTKDREVRKEIAATRGRSKPTNVKMGVRPDGSRYVIQ